MNRPSLNWVFFLLGPAFWRCILAHTEKRGRTRNPDGTKGVNLELLELAVTLRMQRVPWRSIAAKLGVNVSTLIRWKDRDEWKEARIRVLASLPDNLLYLAREVYVKALLRELGPNVKKIDPSLAREVISWFDDRIFRGGQGSGANGDSAGAGPSARAAVVILPPMTKGVESRPAAEVLVEARSTAPENETAPRVPPGKGTTKGRRVVVALPEMKV